MADLRFFMCVWWSEMADLRFFMCVWWSEMADLRFFKASYHYSIGSVICLANVKCYSHHRICVPRFSPLSSPHSPGFAHVWI